MAAEKSKPAPARSKGVLRHALAAPGLGENMLRASLAPSGHFVIEDVGKFARDEKAALAKQPKRKP